MPHTPPHPPARLHASRRGAPGTAIAASACTGAFTSPRAQVPAPCLWLPAALPSLSDPQTPQTEVRRAARPGHREILLSPTFRSSRRTSGAHIWLVFSHGPPTALVEAAPTAGGRGAAAAGCASTTAGGARGPPPPAASPAQPQTEHPCFLVVAPAPILGSQIENSRDITAKETRYAISAQILARLLQ